MTVRFLSAAILLAFLAQAAADTAAGYIVARKGDWTDEKGAPIDVGQPVTVGAKLQPLASGSLTIAFLDGHAKEYPSAFTVPRLLEQVKPNGPVAAVLAKLNQNRDEIFGISRGAAQLHPAVIPLHDGRVELAPVLGSLAVGDYAIELRPRDGGTPISAKCHVEESTAPAPAPGLKPGLFTLRVSSPDGTFFGSVGVLIPRAQDSEARRASFDEALQMTAGWPPSIDAGVVQKFLALWLAELVH